MNKDLYFKRLMKQVGQLAGARKKRPQPQELPGQPLDRELLTLSQLFRKSRKLYLKLGGTFQASLVSSPRTLSSAILLEPRIEYSPIESELFWAATDPTESKDPTHFLKIRSYTSSLFHEQNHRILWKMLPPPPKGTQTEEGFIRRYLHLAEALVIMADHALADELESTISGIAYECGSIYNPGSQARRELSQQDYRDYLRVSAYVSYLLLELNEPNEIRPWLPKLFPEVSSSLRVRAWKRASKIDTQFIRVTNPFWQEKFSDQVAIRLRKGRNHETPLFVPEYASESSIFFRWCDQWIKLLEIK